MDVRQLRAEKAALGRMVEVRFNMLHNHRKLDELEPAVVDYLQANGTIKVSTKENLFELSLKEERVNLVIQECRKSDGIPYHSVPVPIQLFCNESITLHKNQQQFWHLTTDEVSQVLTEFKDLATADGFFVEKGRHVLQLHLKDDKFLFDEYA
jgi:hypothetical protein